MTSFGRLSKSFSARKGRSWILTLTPFLRMSASNTPNSMTAGVRFKELIGIKTESLQGRPQVYHRNRAVEIDFVSPGARFKAFPGPHSPDNNSAYCAVAKPLSASHSLHERITPGTLTPTPISGQSEPHVQSRGVYFGAWADEDLRRISESAKKIRRSGEEL